MFGKSIHPVLLVATGGALGALARGGLDYVAIVFPAYIAVSWSTIAVNLIGAFLLGLVTGLWSNPDPKTVEDTVQMTRNKNLLLLVGTGFCGAFTTYSTFALALLINSASTLNLIIEAFTTVIAGLCFAAVGWMVAEKYTQQKASDPEDGAVAS